MGTKHHWTPPRVVDIHSKDGKGLGFSVRGSAPVVVVGVEPFGLAETAGIREGDIIVEVVKKINVEAKHLRIAVITPIKPWIKYRRESLRTFSMVKSKVSANRMSISSAHSFLSSS